MRRVVPPAGEPQATCFHPDPAPSLVQRQHAGCAAASISGSTRRCGFESRTEVGGWAPDRCRGGVFVFRGVAQKQAKLTTVGSGWVEQWDRCRVRDRRKPHVS